MPNRMSEGPGSDIREWIDSLADIPFFCMNISSRLLLSNALNPTACTITAKSGVTSDWMGLGELLGFHNDEMEAIAREHTQPIKGLLEALASNVTRGVWACPDLKQLLNYLLEMERFDLLEDQMFRRSIGRDANLYRRNASTVESSDAQPCELKESGVQASAGSQEVCRGLPAVSVCLEETPLGAPTPDFPTSPKEEMRVVEGSHNTMEDIIYDAFVSYTAEDWWFVERMMSILEQPPFNLRLCVDLRDMLAGGSKNTVTASIIEDRCKKTILVISHKYLSDLDCEFHYKFSQSISQGSKNSKVIPVVIQNITTFPAVLKDLCKLYFLGCENSKRFWSRLAKSIKTPSRVPAENTPRHSPTPHPGNGSAGCSSSSSRVTSSRPQARNASSVDVTSSSRPNTSQSARESTPFLTSNPNSPKKTTHNSSKRGSNILDFFRR